VKRIAWTDQAKADIRVLDKTVAMRILHALDRFARSGTGDVKKLQGDREELRRLPALFVHTGEEVIEIRSVQHRREAWRTE
jgi:phage-related protein